MEQLTFHAPGRVNLIGEHTDYNGGYVLPCALRMGTLAKVTMRDDDMACFASANFPDTHEVPLNRVEYDPAHTWANYPKGVLFFLQQVAKEKGIAMRGFNIVLDGDIPNEAGLSSSASVEVVTAVALNEVFGLGLSMLELVKIAKRAENEFCNVNCGIMDQFAVGMCKKDHAVFLHCNTLEYEHVPLNFGDYKIVIMNTNKKRTLADSKYNERRAECEQAAAILGVAELAELSPENFREDKLADPILLKRARHIIHENHRVKMAVEAMRNNSLADFGRLLVESHNSLRDDYEVSCRELDVLVEAALKNPACLGARMTGAGFGGCAIALVKDECVADFSREIVAAYESAIGYAPSLYVQESGDGARRVYM